MNHNYIINENEVHVWYYFLDLSDQGVDFFYNLLSEEEKKEINKIKVPVVRNRRVISKAIVKNIISMYLGLNIHKIKFSYNQFGKPVLSEDINFPGLNFNISHSGSLGMIALVKNNQIGIDLEQIIELADLDDIISLCFSKHEQHLFNSLSGLEKTKLFYKIWTGKEAFIKAIGKGFSFPLQNITFTLNNNKEIRISEISGLKENLHNWYVYNSNPRQDYTSAIVVNLNSFLAKEFEWNQTEINK